MNQRKSNRPKPAAEVIEEAKKTEAQQEDFDATNYWPETSDGDNVVTGGGQDAEHYFTPANGRTLWGHLLGAERMTMLKFGTQDGELEDRIFLLFETTRPCVASKPRSQPEVVPAGTLVRLGFRTKLDPLVQLLYLPFMFTVGVQCTGQRALQGGRKMWVFRFQAEPSDNEKPRIDKLFAGNAVEPYQADETLGKQRDPRFIAAAPEMTKERFKQWRQGEYQLPAPGAAPALSVAAGGSAGALSSGEGQSAESEQN